MLIQIKAKQHTNEYAQMKPKPTYFQPCRRSGRTYRMAQHALDMAVEGWDVTLFSLCPKAMDEYVSLAASELTGLDKGEINIKGSISFARYIGEECLHGLTCGRHGKYIYLFDHAIAGHPSFK